MAQSDLRQVGAVLTSHVLDMTKGGPAAGVPIVLSKSEDGQYSDVAESVTNADGRCDAALLSEGTAPGDYRLRFQIGAYFGANAGLFDQVDVDFHIDDATCHYHVPLVASPWGFSTYRGAPPSRAPQQDAPIFPPLGGRPDGKDQPAAAPPGVGGQGITTHVIDLAQGKGAEGLSISVRRLTESQETSHVAKHHVTTAEGRTGQWLIEPGQLDAGVYELLFYLGEYYSQAARWTAAPFFNIARLRIKVCEPLTHYHLPLLISPWGYSIYRGS